MNPISKRLKRIAQAALRTAAPIALCSLSVFGASRAAPASEVGDFLGRRVTKVEVIIEGAPSANVSELRSMIEVTSGQDYSPVRIHDSLVRLYRSGVVSSARVEGSADGAAGVALRFVVRPQARIENVVFEGTPVLGVVPGERFTLVAPQGRVFADKVMFATNAYSHLFAQLRRSQTPAFTYMIATQRSRMRSVHGLESASAGRVCVMMTAMNVGNLPAALTRCLVAFASIDSYGAQPQELPCLVHWCGCRTGCRGPTSVAPCRSPPSLRSWVSARRACGEEMTAQHSRDSSP